MNNYTIVDVMNEGKILRPGNTKTLTEKYFCEYMFCLRIDWSSPNAEVGPIAKWSNTLQLHLNFTTFSAIKRLMETY